LKSAQITDEKMRKDMEKESLENEARYRNEKETYEKHRQSGKVTEESQQEIIRELGQEIYTLKTEARKQKQRKDRPNETVKKQKQNLSKDQNETNLMGEGANLGRQQDQQSGRYETAYAAEA
jgi:hypothetical protein